MNKKLIISSLQDAMKYRNQIIENSNQTSTKLCELLSVNNGFGSLKEIKFTKCGQDPLFDSSLNFIEQVNQTFTYLVCLRAVEQLLILHPATSFVVNFGTQSGFDICSMDGDIICECFAATSPKSNQKLEKDAHRVDSKDAKYKYVIFYSSDKDLKYIDKVSNKYNYVKIMSLSEI